MRTAAILLALSRGLLGHAAAFAHDPDTGAPNWITEGEYRGPDGMHCCGVKDCDRLDPALVQATPRGFVLHAYKDELVPYSMATPSEDGHYWRCHSSIIRGLNNIIIDPGDRRCFFAPVGTE